MQKFSDWLMESSEPFMVLYRVNKGGEVNPTQTKLYSRQEKEETQGVFLSRQPYMVATHHQIMPGRQGNLNAYKIHKSIKREPEVSSGVFDGAWEMFIPTHIWEDYLGRGLIEYLGHSFKNTQAIGRSRRIEGQDAILMLRLEREIEQIKQFVLGNKPTTINITLGKYFHQYIISKLLENAAKKLFDQHDIPYRADIRRMV